jgi:molecular chaperone GrpE
MSDKPEQHHETPGQTDANAPDNVESTATPEPGADGEHAELAGLLEDARAKADEHWNELLRTRAEIENMRRRMQRDIENAHKYGLEKFIQALLPVLDSMELGLAAADGEGEQLEKIREGMSLTFKMFADEMEKVGVARLDPQGEPFNPEFHQAMTMVESPDVAPNTVIDVMQKGYLLNERLVRPAMVVVSKSGG